MPQRKVKNNSFNLITREVKLKQNVRGEVSWYSRLNVLFLIVITSLGVATYAFGLYIEQTETARKQELVDIANRGVNIAEKNQIKGKINTLNDKFTIYKDVNGQNFDVNTFYNDFKKAFPLAQINKFTVRPDASFVEIEVLVPNNGYIEFPKFIDTLNSTEKYESTTIKSIIFLTSETDQSQTSADVGLRMTLEIPKTSLITTN